MMSKVEEVEILKGHVKQMLEFAQTLEYPARYIELDAKIEGKLKDLGYIYQSSDGENANLYNIYYNGDADVEWREVKKGSRVRLLTRCRIIMVGYHSTNAYTFDESEAVMIDQVAVKSWLEGYGEN